MQPGFQVLYCICKLQINGIARYYVSGEETSINLNMLVNQSIQQQKIKVLLHYTCIKQKVWRLKLFDLHQIQT